MLFINAENQYPRHIGDLLNAHPDYVEGDALPEGWHLVIASEFPALSADETFEEVFPVLNESRDYVQTFEVRPMTTEEIEHRDAPITAKAKLVALGLTEVEINALTRGLIR